jgi:hypothetical protein
MKKPFSWVCLSSDTFSDIWKQFHEAVNIEATPPTPVVLCKRCLKEYTHPRNGKNSSTSTLNKHIESHQKRDLNEQTQRMKPLKAYFSGSASRVVSPNIGITKTELQTLLLHTAVACNWAFDQFDDPYFRDMLHRAFPGHTIPGRKKISTLLVDAAIVARADMRKILTENLSRISLALDCWTSSNRWEFMGMSSLYCSMIVCAI